MLKIGILGMGGMGWHHARRYPHVPNAQITAIADVVPERLEAKEAVAINLEDGAKALDLSQAARYPSAAQLIAEADVDVVDICLPTYLHAEYAIAALEAGIHVLCEKPMALSVADCDRMIAAARAADRRLMIAQCLRFWPEYLYLQKMIIEQPLGALLSLNMSRIGGRPRWSPDNWFLDPQRSGGALLDLHIHDVDYVNAVFGAPDRLYATGRAMAEPNSYDVIHACFGYDGGPQIHMHAGWSTAQVPFQAGFDAWFERGFARYADWKLTVFDNLDEVAGHPADIEPGDGYLNEIAYFLDCVETGAQPTRCLPESTRDSIALIDKEIESIKSLVS
ncbi:MAG TPA: Gfo/Idh/MocA family oxidoreductase [Anaerolineae bacterium]|nr:Gfo/Idh/MocA family oxidoreductase [Anaerolineae bacterium]HQI86185.1 Gfo/Idh/MocA family oxidoreductase [Anaerolineae bacterium]